MAGPNLELFKFGMYLFFPLAIMVHYGDPEWYHQNVLPYRDKFWPKAESLYRPPRNTDDLQSAMEEMKEKRLAKRQARLEQEGSASPSSFGSTPPAQAQKSALDEIKTHSAFTRSRAANERLV